MKFSSGKRKILIIIIVLLFIFSLNFFQKEVRGFFYSISSSMQKKIWQAGDYASDFFEAFLKAGDFRKENEALRLKNQELSSSQNSLKEIEEENKTLREAMGLGLEKEFKLELAKVIGKDANQDAILIDIGLKDGVSRGMPLITPQKVLIGNVIEVFPGHSRVLLISDKESAFEARISSSSIFGLAKGLGKFRIFLDLLPKNESIKKGDLVVSNGFLIGLISEVKQIDVKPFQQAEVSPFFDISNLDKAFIVIDF